MSSRDELDTAWRSKAAELERNGFAVVEDALTAAQVDRILRGARDYVAARQNGNYADALGFCPDFADLVDVPEVLDVVSHWLGPNIYVNHSHVTWRPPGAGAPHAWHRDGGVELGGCGRAIPLFLKVGFVLTDMTMTGMGNIGCLPTSRAPVWEEVERTAWTARPTSERAVVQPDGTVRSVRAITNADTLLLRAGAAVLFEQCWHSGLSNADNSHDRCVFYVQFARRFLQPMDPAQYNSLRAQPCTPVRQQLLPLMPADVEYLPNNRSSLYYPPKTLPLLERQRARESAP